MALILPFILTLWSLCIATVTTTPQLCYTEAGVLAPDYIVPCWPSQKAQQYSCCKIGDKCLDHSACYNAQTGVTYQYGCTDSAYRDPNICPTKCGLDGKKSNYVGMVFCNGSRGLPTDTWICHHPDNNCGNCPPRGWDPKIERMPDTSCGDIKHEGQYVAFSANSTLSDTVPLPTDANKYFSSNEDRWKVSTTSDSTAATQIPSVSDQPHKSSPPSSTSIVTGTPSPISSSSSKTQTVAMAVGFGAGVPAVLALVGYFIYCLRKHRNQSRPERQRDEPDEHRKDHGISESEGPYGYGHKAELPGDRPVHEFPDSTSHITELEGSTAGELSPLQSPFVSPLLSEYSDKGDTREYRVSGIDASPIHELPG